MNGDSQQDLQAGLVYGTSVEQGVEMGATTMGLVNIPAQSLQQQQIADYTTLNGFNNNGGAGNSVAVAASNETDIHDISDASNQQNAVNDPNQQSGMSPQTPESLEQLKQQLAHQLEYYFSR
jgi:hypothetical protein